MSIEEKIISSRCSSPKGSTLESYCPSGQTRMNANVGKTPNQQSGAVHDEPVAILWDIENCPVPTDVRAEDVGGNLRMALRVHPVINGAVTLFSAYGDFNNIPRRLREGCQRTGVKLVDVPNGRKDAADKAILVDMFLFALDNRPPSSILLISGDVDFAPALHILGQRGYTIILVVPCKVGISSALTNAGRFVWDWPSVARGEGFVPPKTYMPRGPDFGGYFTSFSFGDYQDTQNEEEAIVYRGNSQSNTGYSYSSVQQYNDNNNAAAPCPRISSSSRSQSLPFGLSEAQTGDQGWGQDWWVQPGDIQGLKGQLARLCEIYRGTLPLSRVPSEYIRSFGRPLYMQEYGVCRLVELIQKMADTFVIMGKGSKKLLCLRNYSSERLIKKCPSPPAMVILRKDQKGKRVMVDSEDIGICPTNVGSSSEDLSDEERNADYVERFDSFRMEVQELLTCYACLPVPISVFESLYEQRYKKALNFQKFGVDGLEELMDKVRDVVVLCEDEQKNKKFLISSCVSG